MELLVSLFLSYISTGWFCLSLIYASPRKDQPRVVREDRFTFYVLSWPLFTWKQPITPYFLTDSAKLILEKKRLSPYGIFIIFLLCLPVWFPFFALFYALMKYGEIGNYILGIFFSNFIVIFIPGLKRIYYVVTGISIFILWVPWSYILSIILPRRRKISAEEKLREVLDGYKEEFLDDNLMGEVIYNNTSEALFPLPDEVVSHIQTQETTASEIALRFIISQTISLLTSESCYTYRGLLNMKGEAVKNAHNIALDKLVKMDAYSKDQAEEVQKELEETIARSG